MQTSLAATALLMGIAGGPHCVAMCGAACAGLGQAAGPKSNSALWLFQAGRILGYTILGGVAAASIQAMGWLTVQSAALRPVWTLFHVAVLALGLVLIYQARQPVWLEATGQRIWATTRKLSMAWGRGAPWFIGLLWVFLPCGLLYSAVLVAAMTGDIVDGALVMTLFALGTSVSMLAGPWLWLRLKHSSGEWGIRLAGLALAVSSFWALWMGLVQNAAPWCLSVYSS
jgi:sulfite exporter TauE/SafE